MMTQVPHAKDFTLNLQMNNVLKMQQLLKDSLSATKTTTMQTLLLSLLYIRLIQQQQIAASLSKLSTRLR